MISPSAGTLSVVGDVVGRVAGYGYAPSTGAIALVGSPAFCPVRLAHLVVECVNGASGSIQEAHFVVETLQGVPVPQELAQFVVELLCPAPLALTLAPQGGSLILTGNSPSVSVLRSFAAAGFWVDLHDGQGLRDWMRYLFNADQVTQALINEPVLANFDVTETEASMADTWATPLRGAYVEYSDPRFVSRDAGVPDGLLFSGYIANEPEYQFLGKRFGEEVWAYRLQCTSEDYLINLHEPVPRVYVNRTHGFILKDQLSEMFSGTVPFTVTGIQDGGTERLYQVDKTKKWTEIAKDFADADGYEYHVLGGCIFYQPLALLAPDGSPAQSTPTIEKTDPCYNPDNVTVKRVSAAIANDVTVLGLDEPGTAVQEVWVSDGFKGEQPLAKVPFGVDEIKILNDDFTGEIDAGVWTEVDTGSPDEYLEAFDGALNVVGGSGTYGDAYLMSRKSVELTGVVEFRDGEIYFPDTSPFPAGEAFVGGLHTTEVPNDASRWCGWELDTQANTLTPWGPDGLETGSAFTINRGRHYILRKQVQVSSLPAPTTRRGGGVEFVYDPWLYSSQITWLLDELDYTDVTNVTRQRFEVLSKQYVAAPPEFVLYSPVTSKDAHFVMNFVNVKRPVQARVTVDGVSQQIGSYLDGGRCVLTAENGRGKLSWYAVPNANPDAVTEEWATEITTIPALGSLVKVHYHENVFAKARVRSAASIAAEQAIFGDDGVRAKTLNVGDVKPAPRTSEECLMVARAYLADNQQAQWEGGYRFLSKEGHETEITQWPRPGDLLSYVDPFTQDVYELPIANVTAKFLARGVYGFEIEFGVSNRFEEARRALYRLHRSSLDEDAVVAEADVREDDTFDDEMPPADPADFTITAVSDTDVSVLMNQWDSMEGIDGYEVRKSDSGWGEGGHLSREVTASFSIDRTRRDTVWYIKPYIESGSPAVRRYSQRAALLRIQVPLENAAEVVSVVGTLCPETLASAPYWCTFDLTLPSSPDVAGVQIRRDNIDGEIVYEGCGLDYAAGTAPAWYVALSNEAGTVVSIPTGRTIYFEIPSSGGPYPAGSATFFIRTYTTSHGYSPGTTWELSRVGAAAGGLITGACINNGSPVGNVQVSGNTGGSLTPVTSGDDVWSVGVVAVDTDGLEYEWAADPLQPPVQGYVLTTPGDRTNTLLSVSWDAWTPPGGKTLSVYRVYYRRTGEEQRSFEVSSSTVAVDITTNTQGALGPFGGYYFYAVGTGTTLPAPATIDKTGLSQEAFVYFPAKTGHGVVLDWPNWIDSGTYYVYRRGVLGGWARRWEVTAPTATFTDDLTDSTGSTSW